VTRILRYFAVNDFGTVVNPMIVAGQLHGALRKATGQALMEEAATTKAATELPARSGLCRCRAPRTFHDEVGDHPSPAKTNPLGTKGCGEAGCAGSLVCIVNAVVDALSEYGVTQIEMPLTRNGSGVRSRTQRSKAA